MKTHLTTTISLLYILLFTYAAVSKILDFENFQVQLGQSPLLSAFAGWVSYGVILSELYIVLLLSIPKYRQLGLHCSFFLMVMFTAFIIIILNFSAFVPCSCGGILEKLGWTEHLIFNGIFILLSLAAILMNTRKINTYCFLALNTIVACSTVTVLFILSEEKIHHQNNFVRRFSDHVVKVNQTDLKFNSFYFAGANKNILYFGNHTAPLLLTETDTALQYIKKITTHINNTSFPFRAVEIRINPPHFYVIDGTVPCFFLGNIENWTANLVAKGKIPFASAVPIDTNAIAYRSHDKYGENILGKSTFTPLENIKVNPNLLQKQFDGNFDTDGMLHFDDYWQKLIYLYRYRNQYQVTDTNLNLLVRGNTIDTIRRAQIKVANVTARGEKKLAEPPLTVNKNSTVYKSLLFVNSGLIGKYEDAKMWKQASVIDVYDLKNQSYIASFYIYHIGKDKMRRFFVRGNNCYAFIGRYIVSYKLTNTITKHYLKNQSQNKSIPAGNRGKIENLYKRVDQ